MAETTEATHQTIMFKLGGIEADIKFLVQSNKESTERWKAELDAYKLEHKAELIAQSVRHDILSKDYTNFRESVKVQHAWVVGAATVISFLITFIKDLLK